MTTRLTCPECDAVLRIDGEVATGEEITCPKCDTSFRAKPERAAPAKAARAVARDDDDYDDEDDRPRSKKKSKKPAKKGGSLLAIPIVAAVVLAGAGLAFAAWYFVDRPAKVDATPVIPIPPNGDQLPNFGPNARPKTEQPPIGLPKTTAKKKAAPGEVGLDVGNKAMEISAEDIDGKQFKLSDYRGKVVVLDFWGHW